MLEKESLLKDGLLPRKRSQVARMKCWASLKPQTSHTFTSILHLLDAGWRCGLSCTLWSDHAGIAAKVSHYRHTPAKKSTLHKKRLSEHLQILIWDVFFLSASSALFSAVTKLLANWGTAVVVEEEENCSTYSRGDCSSCWAHCCFSLKEAPSHWLCSVSGKEPVWLVRESELEHKVL